MLKRYEKVREASAAGHVAYSRLQHEASGRKRLTQRPATRSALVIGAP